MAPHGLGYLVVGGYAGDARFLFCPSTGGNMPVTYAYGTNMPGWDVWYRTYAATSPKDLQRAGGFDAKSIMYGDWKWLNPWSVGYGRWYGAYNLYGDLGHAVQSDYMYRNGPVTVPVRAWHVEQLGSLGGGWYAETNAIRLFDILVGGTKPAVRTSVNGPLFKTQKLLAGRAIVADAFGRNDYGNDTAWSLGMEPPVGEGYYAHRDGYNVLYGDGHVRWYGDPQQQFMWWPAMYYDFWPSSLRMLATLANGTQGTGLTWWYNSDGSDWNWWSDPRQNRKVWNKGGTYAWHLLDVAAGIDVDVRPAQ